MLSQRQFITLILEKRKRALRMKKLVAVVLALVLVLSVTSATWVYDGVSSSPHPYYSNAVINQATLDFRGRLDNTASGLLEFHGNFQN